MNILSAYFMITCLIPLHSLLCLTLARYNDFQFFSRAPPYLYCFANAIVSAWNTALSTAPFNCYFFPRSFYWPFQSWSGIPSLYRPYQNTYHPLFHNCQFIYLYFLLRYTCHEDSGCVHLIHIVSSAIAQCLAQTGIHLMNAWISKKTESVGIHKRMVTDHIMNKEAEGSEWEKKSGKKS